MNYGDKDAKIIFPGGELQRRGDQKEMEIAVFR